MPTLPGPSASDSSYKSLDDTRSNGNSTHDDVTSRLLNGDNHTMDSNKLEPIAVIGLDLKFPAEATSPEAFWRMMMGARSARSGIPANRLNVDAFYQSSSNRSGQFNSSGGHFIHEDLAGFDSAFFSMTPAEAACMDPMQRWLLETTYTALENAGVSIENVAGSNMAVFVGSFARDYDKILSRDMQMDLKYKAIGTSASLLANRLSWFYNLTGPSVALDTACSSSLYALHLACQSLRSGESSTAIVGGCNVCFDPESFVALADLNFLSPTSTCYSFDHRANGYARGEGFGVVILKPISQALKDKNTIRAVIRATGANQDGRTPGLTQPSSEAQVAMIRQTYCSAGLSMRETRYIEAHGTGTAVGDPLEASAIGSAFANRPRDEALLVGAVKTNIGHLEGASGVAGLIKAILTLEKGVIPPNIWFERLNPRIPAEKLNIKFPLEPTPWPTNGLRRASVNSFGFGGANAHVVLDDAYNYLKLRNIEGNHRTTSIPPRAGSLITTIGETTCSAAQNGQSYARDARVSSRPQLLVWSSTEESGLERLAACYLNYLNELAPYQNEQSYLADLAWTLSEKRSRFAWKSFAIAGSVSHLQHILAEGLSPPLRSYRAPVLGFVFTGQGAQWYAMGRELMQYSMFQQGLEEAGSYYQDLGCQWSLVDELLKGKNDSRLENAAYSQPICTALQIALLDLLYSWEIQPTAVVGHSSGEIAAAYCAGGLSKKSAWKVAYFRGLVTASLAESKTESGAMLSVGLSESAIQPYLSRSDSPGGHVTIACINSAKNITLSGSVSYIVAIQGMLEQDNVFAQRLKVDVAYHSPQMNEIAPMYHRLTQGLCRRTPDSKYPIMFSSVTGAMVSVDDLSKNEYWIQNLTSRVKFLHALTDLSSYRFNTIEHGVNASSAGLRLDHILEIGPHAALRGPIRDILAESLEPSKIIYSSMLIRGRSAVDSTLEAMGVLHCLGWPLDVAAVNRSQDSALDCSMLVDLPAYPFNHTKKHWRESRTSAGYRFRKYPHHELLGTPVSDWNPLNARWQNIIRISEHPWIRDHQVSGIAIYPAAGLLVMAMEAARQLLDSTSKPIGYNFREVAISKTIVVPPGDDGVEIHVHLQNSKDSSGGFLSWSIFRIYSYDNGTWSENCKGQIAVECQNQTNSSGYDEEKKHYDRQIREDYQNGADRCIDDMDPDSVYNFFKGCGLTFGPCFQLLSNIRYNNTGEAIARTNIRDGIWKTLQSQIRPHIIHPTALDAVFQVVLPAISRGGKQQIATIVPTQFRTLSISVGETRICSLECEETKHTTWLKIYARSEQQGFRYAENSFIALNAESGEPCIVGTFQSTAASETGSTSLVEDKKSRFYSHIDWKPDLDLMDSNSILTYCSLGAGTFREGSGYSLDDCLEVCYQTFQNLSLKDLPKNFADDKPHLRKYVDWMIAQLASRHINGPTTYTQHPGTDKKGSSQLYQRLEQSGPEGKLLVRTARSLEKVLHGKIDALELLFQDGLLDDHYSHYHQESPAYNGALRYVDAYAHKLPDLKILEIGAGTGSATYGILDTLMHSEGNDSTAPRFADYTFTDISPKFLEDARIQFKTYGNRMIFATLNIEQDPLDQGFEPARYDIIVASNVVHATAVLKTSLEHARKLLKPGGKLLLMETTNTEKLLPGFIFGLLPGWWLGTEDYRKSGPLVTRQDWHDVLRSSNFSGVDVVLPREKEPDWSFSLIISTALEASKTFTGRSETMIVCDPNSAVQLRLAAQLEHSLKETLSSQCQIVPIPDVTSTNLNLATCIFLPEVERSVLYNIAEQDYTILQHLVSSVSRLLWVGKVADAGLTPAGGMITGFARSIQSENPDKAIVSLLLHGVQDTTKTAANISKVLRSMSRAGPKDIEGDYLEIDGRLCISRLISADNLDRQLVERSKLQIPKLSTLGQDSSRRLKMTMGSHGLLNTFRFEDAGDTQPLACGHLEVKIKAVGLNFRDLLVALGQDIGENSSDIGIECSGVVIDAGENKTFQVGDRVACLYEGAMATYVRCKACATIKIPDGMTFEAAAGFPVIFTTAYYCIVVKGCLQNGESILIHSGAGGFGQACIQLAKLCNAEIFTTVGNEDKKQHLIRSFNVQADHIFSSRTSSFAAGIKRLTKGRGVDLVINSLTGEALKSTWDCIAPFGRFLEAGKKDIFASAQLPMLPFSRGASFTGVDLISILRNDKEMISHLMQSAMNLMNDGKISMPAPLQVYAVSQVEKTFRHLQSGKSIGKFVITLGDDEAVAIIPSKLPTYNFEANATYVIAGGLGGLGQSIARWMVNRNAKNLILLSRSTTYSEHVLSFLKELRAEGVNVATPPCNISDAKALKSALAACSDMPPIKGCIQSAMVLKDGTFANVCLEDFQAITQPKCEGSWNLHSLLPTKMDFFILLASISGVIGTVGQSAYACGNSYQDALAQYRVARGEKAVSLDLCIMLGFGYVAEREGLADQVKNLGYMTLDVPGFHTILDHFCNPGLPVCSLRHCQVVVGLQTPATVRVQGNMTSWWSDKPMFRAMRQMDSHGNSTIQSTEGSVNYEALIRAAGTVAEVTDIVVDGLQTKLSKTLAIEKGNINVRKPMHIYGVDSLSAVELRMWLRNMIGADVPIIEILGNTSIEALGAVAAIKGRFTVMQMENEK